MRRLFSDTLGFAGCKMIRRILGLAHVADFETIANKDLRARGERRALRLARKLLVDRETFANIEAVGECRRRRQEIDLKAISICGEGRIEFRLADPDEDRSGFATEASVVSVECGAVIQRQL